MEKHKTGRNDPCTCGSSKKYKHCCGNLSDTKGNIPVQTSVAHNAAFNLTAAKQTAINLHTRGKLQEAAVLYRQILLQAPQDFDVLHLFGVLLGQLNKPRDALRHLIEAARFNSAGYANVYNNLSKCILDVTVSLGGFTHIVCPGLAGMDTPQRIFMEDLPELHARPPLVSVVIPCYNHEPYVEEALRSVFSQSYPNIEVIVIDDGSSDQTVTRIEQVLKESPFPVRFIARGNKGAHATINEGMGMANGEYVGILNSDDRYLPFRIEAMVRLLTSSGKGWGLTGTRFIDASGERILYGQNAMADVLMRGLDSLYLDTSITIGFGRFNYAISTGNLFFSKSLLQSLGEFADYRYVHDWDFCLRALAYESPAILHEPAYEYRIHGTNTISESLDRSRSETYRMLHGWKHKIYETTSTNSPRAELLKCASELAMLSTNQAH